MDQAGENQEKTMLINRLLMCIAALLVVIVVQGVGSTAFAGDDVGPSRSMLVSFAGLDLSTPAGVETARERIRHAARMLCRQLRDIDDRSRRENFISCVESAMAGAVPKFEALARLSATSHVARK
jgi:UrcA family protein